MKEVKEMFLMRLHANAHVVHVTFSDQIKPKAGEFITALILKVSASVDIGSAMQFKPNHCFNLLSFSSS